MRKFLYKSITAGSIIVFILIMFDVAISYNLRHSPKAILNSFNEIYNDTTCYDLVVMGNSRAYVQYSPRILDSLLSLSSYNLGFNGQGIDWQMVKYMKYCECHGNPKFYIQNIDLFTMQKSTGFQRELFYPYFYDYSLLSRLERYSDIYSNSEKYIPLYRYKNYFKDFYIYHNDTILYKGFCPKDLLWDGKTLEKLDSILINVDVDIKNEWVTFLKNEQLKGVKILFVYAPVHHLVRDKMLNESYMYNIYDSIATQLNISILDYNNDSMCYDTTYFYNGTHLNRKGAEIFTTKLAHDIDSLGLLK